MKNLPTSVKILLFTMVLALLGAFAYFTYVVDKSEEPFPVVLCFIIAAAAYMALFLKSKGRVAD